MLANHCWTSGTRGQIVIRTRTVVPKTYRTVIYQTLVGRVYNSFFVTDASICAVYCRPVPILGNVCFRFSLFPKRSCIGSKANILGSVCLGRGGSIDNIEDAENPKSEKQQKPQKEEKVPKIRKETQYAKNFVLDIYIYIYSTSKPKICCPPTETFQA